MYDNEEEKKLFEELEKHVLDLSDYENLSPREQWVHGIELGLMDMKEREKEVIRMRLGIDGEAKTQEEVAEKFGISKERVRMIESKFLIKGGYHRLNRDKVKKFLGE